MTDRLIVTFIIIGGLGVCWFVWHYYKARLIHTIQPTEVDIDIHKPTLLYFTGQYCSACKFQQSPIIEQVVAKFGDAVAVKEYDVSRYPEIASCYKVLTLPTTIILDRLGQVSYVNYGVTRQIKLEAQLS